MNRIVGKRPSPAMVIAILALFVALAGVGVAAVKLKKNSVLSKHIKNGEVKSVDVEDNGMTGTDIDESTLGLVPNAQSAETATSAQTAASAQTASSAASAEQVDGASFCSGAVHMSVSTSLSPVCTSGPFTVRASCEDTSGDVLATASLIATEEAFVRSFAETGFIANEPQLNAGSSTTLGGALDFADDGAPIVSRVGSFYAGTAGGAHLAGTFGARVNKQAAGTGTCDVIVSAGG
ncbi:MAG TPA: hypothetical protein VEK39_02685 [Solirubrobacterales bacterium]|nr:hypothetical protein [Solirubrobacterales bacterium]